MEIEEKMDRIVNKARFGIYWFGWDKDTTARYIYISLGKIISKNTKFFYSVEKKYDEDYRLNASQMKEINEKDSSFQVTCQVSAKMLVNMLNRVGIDAKLMKTVNAAPYQQTPDSPSYDVYHYFVLYTGEEDKKYFLTLNADLVNIKFGFATEHFATNVSYYAIDPKTETYRLDKNGQKIQYYEGEQILNSTMSLKKLKEIDKQIGYLTLFGKDTYDYVPNLSNIHRKNVDQKHIDTLILNDNENFYQGLEELFKKFNKERINNLSENEIIELELYILTRTISLIERKLNTHLDNETKTKIINFLLQKDFTSISLELKAFINKTSKENQVDVNGKELYGNAFAISSSMINLLKSIELLITSNNEKTLMENSARYRNSLRNLLKFYIDQRKLRQNQLDYEHQEFSNEFLYKKLKILFMHDFECDETIKTGYIPPFSTYGTLEQQNFIKEYIRKIFQNELSGTDNFNKRILFSSIALDDSLENYSFLIGVYNETNLEEHTYFFTYNPKTNTLEDDISALELIMNYNILSSTVNKKLEEIENSGRAK